MGTIPWSKGRIAWREGVAVRPEAETSYSGNSCCPRMERGASAAGGAGQSASDADAVSASRNDPVSLLIHIAQIARLQGEREML
jgi:hypothetical protein